MSTFFAHGLCRFALSPRAVERLALAGGAWPLPRPPQIRSWRMTRATKTGKPARPKPMDFRVKLTAENYRALTTHIAAAGFDGPHAKQAWLRSLIPAMQPARSDRKVNPTCATGADTFRRLPMPGGQEALAILGNIGTDLRETRASLKKMVEWLDRIDPVFIAEEHRARVRNDLPNLMATLLNRLDETEARVSPRLSSAIDGLLQALRQ